jgi:hypothetical protein
MGANSEEITPADSVVPIFLVPVTAAETAAHEQWLAEVQAAEQAQAEAQATIDAAKESAHEKLAGWGLTPSEIAAIITP